MKKKILLLSFTIVIIMSLIFALGTSAQALESTGNAKMDEFINDSRWTNEVAWGSRSSILKGVWSGCAAYCCDYVNYCYGYTYPTEGTYFTNISEIRAGDVIHIGSGETGHWFVVLKRNGNSLYTAEGNVNYARENKPPIYKTQIGWNYTINHTQNKFDYRWGNENRLLTEAYHFLPAEQHDHNHGEYLWVWGAHPHWKCYRCSICGENWVDKTQPQYVESCEECLAHECDLNGGYRFYEAAHPHYKCYACSLCGKVNRNYNEPTFLEDCEKCTQPSKPVLHSDKSAYYEGTPVIFTWSDTENTTHYSIFVDKKNDSGVFDEHHHIVEHYINSGVSYSNLPTGEYRVHVTSTNSQVSGWPYSESEMIYFSVVKGNTITLDPCGGTCSTPSIVAVYGYQYKEFAEFPTPTRFGYSFDGWYSEKDGQGSKYSSDMKYWGESDTTWYANWILEGNIITLNPCGGSCDTEYIVALYGHKYNEYAELPTPMRFGYSFDGWYSEKGGQGSKYSSDMKYWGKSDTTWYANWIQTNAIDNVSVLDEEVSFTLPMQAQTVQVFAVFYQGARFSETKQFSVPAGSEAQQLSAVATKPWSCCKILVLDENTRPLYTATIVDK